VPSSGTGTTTVTEAGSARHAAEPRHLALAWLFPRPGEPAVDLSAQGEAERIVGRDAACAVRLEGNDVSRRHAALFRADPAAAVTIRDLDSRNGVRVNGRPVTLSPLQAGDVVRLGGWVGVVTPTPGELTEIAPGLMGGVALRTALEPLRRVAPSDLSIVLEGETGTGKEVVTRAVHGWSGRTGPLVAVNCAALPDGLAEAELFGYRRGAFTGADRASPGFFRSAHGGTLLLDEVSDLPMTLQAKLLRVLEQREVQPLGETRPVAIDVRIVVAGQQPLMDAVREGRFRADLLARLDGVTVKLPPLRRRREDVPPLFSHLLKVLGQGRAPAVESDLVERLCLHDWPFNVRELVQLVRRLLVLQSDESTLRAAHLPDRIGAGAEADPRPAPTLRATAAVAGAQAPGVSEPIELPALVVALRTSGGNVARAAAMLGITRQRAYRLMEGQAVDLEALRKQEDPRR
jgi:sigma-54 dependent transcriptional regulator, acetoin dehydrogenase operon transcriptional activator AcoR